MDVINYLFEGPVTIVNEKYLGMVVVYIGFLKRNTASKMAQFGRSKRSLSIINNNTINQLKSKLFLMTCMIDTK